MVLFAVYPGWVLQNLLEGDPLTWIIFLVAVVVILGVLPAIQLWVVIPRDQDRIRKDAALKGFRVFRPKATWVPPAEEVLWHLICGFRFIGPSEGNWYKVRYRTVDGKKHTAWVLVPHASSDRQYLSWYPIETGRHA